MNAFFDGLAGADEVELHAAAIRPVFERPRLKLGGLIHRDGARAGRALEDPIQTAAAYGPAPGSEAGARIDPAHDSADTTPLD